MGPSAEHTALHSRGRAKRLASENSESQTEDEETRQTLGSLSVSYTTAGRDVMSNEKKNLMSCSRFVYIYM